MGLGLCVGGGGGGGGRSSKLYLLSLYLSPCKGNTGRFLNHNLVITDNKHLSVVSPIKTSTVLNP